MHCGRGWSARLGLDQGWRENGEVQKENSVAGLDWNRSVWWFEKGIGELPLRIGSWTVRAYLTCNTKAVSQLISRRGKELCIVPSHTIILSISPVLQEQRRILRSGKSMKLSNFYNQIVVDASELVIYIPGTNRHQQGTNPATPNQLMLVTQGWIWTLRGPSRHPHPSHHSHETLPTPVLV